MFQDPKQPRLVTIIKFLSSKISPQLSYAVKKYRVSILRTILISHIFCDKNMVIMGRIHNHVITDITTLHIPI